MITGIGAGVDPALLQVGLRVKVDTLSFHSVGTVADVSTEYERGFGTKLYPAFYIEFDDGSAEWFNGVALTPTPSKTR
ncbi:DUF7245 domain-containing zinc-binding protein [Actinotalea subterranea]|uniref:DUF7245 domain-containing zinc-binding protein n=1 Tax=Actinotalea subterranea TaxID=2607497 RepID=UPI0011EF8CBF|nr:hypothetical protein [Actinotalea subterranea]